MTRRPSKSVQIEIYVEIETSDEAIGDVELIDPEDLQKIVEVINSGVDLRVKNDSDEDLTEKNQNIYHVVEASDDDSGL
ncbi:hypothetical protein CPB83DRAFT_20657 [Crepidotus variabilis]|uniref:Uncharacterized protein n=1 Tax=Crepidotus variabilis TaxID=179855 RepID=A0A9P6EVK9_9AGAR|nr:hypothetical protein CPB83DRAFT_20657 [Crepidotus variabilis]